jgi:DHA2 family multidrug resistance protein-like MFS transporter
VTLNAPSPHLAPLPDAAPADGLPVPRRYWAVAAVALAIFMSVLDGAIANTALPSIARELRASPGEAIWIVNAYQLAITVCLLPFAALGDRLGYRRVYLAGLVVFTAGSVACALSHSLIGLAAARVFQGLGAAGIMSINSALVRFTYPQRLLGRGIGFNAVVLSVAAAVGPTVASAILAVTSWQWLFAINLPFGLAALAIGRWALPKTKGSDQPFDVVSALLNAVAFGLLIFGAERIARTGSPEGYVEVGVGLVAGVVLARRELKRTRPLVPVDLLRIPIFGLSVATSVVSFAAQMMAFVALPFFFGTVQGRSAVEIGLLMTPWPIAVGIMAPIAGRLADRYPAGLLGGIGLGLFAVGLGSLAFLPPHAGTVDIVWRMVICGLGFGFFQSPNNRAMVSSSPRERSGAAGGMLATARLLGQTTGAVSVAIFFHVAGDRATVSALGTACAIAAAAAVVSLLRLWVHAKADRPASERGVADVA